MKLSDVVSSSLSLIAIVISIVVWRTADTRATELRDKRISYYVEQSIDTSVVGYETPIVDDGSASNKKCRVDFVISNDGSLPTKDVTIAVSTTSQEGTLPPYSVDLNPPVDHEVVVQGNVLVVRLKSPMGPKSKLQAHVVFKVITDHQMPVHGFRPEQASVESEVGAAALVASLSNSQNQQDPQGPGRPPQPPPDR